MGEPVHSDDDFVCHCARMSCRDIMRLLNKRDGMGFAELYEEHGISAQCASCEFEVRGLVDDHHAEKGITGEISQRDPVRKQHEGIPFVRWISKALFRSKVSLKGGLFALMTPDLESKVVLSNLNFPEGNYRPNGRSIRFRISVVDSCGKTVAEKRYELASNASRSYPLSEVYPECPQNFVGAFYLEFFNLEMTGSLRPYAVLEAKRAAPSVGARCHYHDKYATFIDPGYFQTAWPFQPGQECWIAASNCQNLPYHANAVLKGGSREIKSAFSLPPFGSRWSRIGDLFDPNALGDPQDFEPGLFFLDCPQHIMIWFFWHNISTKTWIGNHH